MLNKTIFKYLTRVAFLLFVSVSWVYASDYLKLKQAMTPDKATYSCDEYVITTEPDKYSGCKNIKTQKTREAEKFQESLESSLDYFGLNYLYNDPFHDISTYEISEQTLYSLNSAYLMEFIKLFRNKLVKQTATCQKGIEAGFNVGGSCHHLFSYATKKNKALLKEAWRQLNAYSVILVIHGEEMPKTKTYYKEAITVIDMVAGIAENKTL